MTVDGVQDGSADNSYAKMTMKTRMRYKGPKVKPCRWSFDGDNGIVDDRDEAHNSIYDVLDG